MEKRDWHRKILEPEIVAKWKEESKRDLREELFEYSMKELAFIRDLREVDTGIEPSGVEMVWVNFLY